VIPRAVFDGPHPRAERFLGILYAVPSGISALQFTRWHLTHHAELGDEVADPKRHYLSPKINKPWYKLLYFTPALFPIYFRAARRETASYPETLRSRIAWERRGTILFHVAVMVALSLAGGAGVLARGRHHDDEVGAVDLVNQILGAAGKIVEPTAHRERLAAARRAGERRGGEEGGVLPRPAGQVLDDAFACGIERDHLDGARLRIRPIDAEPGLRRRAHAGRFTVHPGSSLARLLHASLHALQSRRACQI